MRPASCLALLAVASVALPAVASATVIASNSTTTLYAGYSATAPALPPDGATSPTYDIGTGGVWTNPVAGSSWVSYNANTAPGGSFTAPNGYYAYEINFVADGGPITLSVLADDTVSIYLNDLTQILPEGAGPYPKCAVNQPNCVTPYTFTFSTLPGLQLLDFEVHQANSNATGLDFYGTSSVTPEPSSLLLLGTGLVGSAGALLRRVRRS